MNKRTSERISERKFGLQNILHTISFFILPLLYIFPFFVHIFIQWKHNHILTYSYTYVVCTNFRCFHYKYIPNYTILIRSVIKLNWIFHMRAEKLSIFHKKASVHTHTYTLWLIHNSRVTWIAHLMKLIRVGHENVKIFLNLISSNYVAIKFSSVHLMPPNSWIAVCSPIWYKCPYNYNHACSWRDVFAICLVQSDVCTYNIEIITWRGFSELKIIFQKKKEIHT